MSVGARKVTAPLTAGSKAVHRHGVGPAAPAMHVRDARPSSASTRLMSLSQRTACVAAACGERPICSLIQGSGTFGHQRRQDARSRSQAVGPCRDRRRLHRRDAGARRGAALPDSSPRSGAERRVGGAPDRALPDAGADRAADGVYMFRVVFRRVLRARVRGRSSARRPGYAWAAVAPGRAHRRVGSVSPSAAAEHEAPGWLVPLSLAWRSPGSRSRGPCTSGASSDPAHSRQRWRRSTFSRGAVRHRRAVGGLYRGLVLGSRA